MSRLERISEKNAFAKLQKIIVQSIMCVLLFVVWGCGKQYIDAVMEAEECNVQMSTGSADCIPISFMEGVSYHSKCNCYIIRGTVQDVTLHRNEYGSHQWTSFTIKLKEDLKGNFPDNVHTFVTWVNSLIGWNVSSSIDYWTYYGNQSVVIFMYSLSELSAISHQYGYSWETELKNTEDFETHGCVNSVVKISGNYAIGRIFPFSYEDSKKSSWENDIVLLSTFQKRIKEILRNLVHDNF